MDELCAHRGSNNTAKHCSRLQIFWARSVASSAAALRATVTCTFGGAVVIGVGVNTLLIPLGLEEMSDVVPEIPRVWTKTQVRRGWRATGNCFVV